MKSCGAYFLEKCKNEKVCFDCAGVCGLHVSPSHGAPRATPKSKKKHNIFQNLLFLSKNAKYDKKGSQKMSKRVRGFPGWRPWGRLGHPNLFLNTKSIPKVLQKWLQGCKNYTKRPGGLREALTIQHF